MARRKEQQPKVIVGANAQDMQQQANGLLGRDLQRDTQFVRDQLAGVKKNKILNLFGAAFGNLGYNREEGEARFSLRERGEQLWANAQRPVYLLRGIGGVIGRIGTHNVHWEEDAIEKRLRQDPNASLSSVFDEVANKRGGGIRGLVRGRQVVTDQALEDARERIAHYESQQNEAAGHRQEVVGRSAFTIEADEANAQVREFGQTFNDLARAARGQVVAGLTQERAQEVLADQAEFRNHFGELLDNEEITQRMKIANITEEGLREGIRENVRLNEANERAAQEHDQEIREDFEVALVGLQADIVNLPPEQQSRATQAWKWIKKTGSRMFDTLARPAVGVATGVASALLVTGGLVAMAPVVVGAGIAGGLALSIAWAAKRAGDMRATRQQAAREYAQDLMGGLPAVTTENHGTRLQTLGRLANNLLNPRHRTEHRWRQVGQDLLYLMSPGRRQAFIQRAETIERGQDSIGSTRELIDGQIRVQPSVEELINSLQAANNADRVLTLDDLTPAIMRQAELAVLGLEDQVLTEQIRLHVERAKNYRVDRTAVVGRRRVRGKKAREGYTMPSIAIRNGRLAVITVSPNRGGFDGALARLQQRAANQAAMLERNERVRLQVVNGMVQVDVSMADLIDAARAGDNDALAEVANRYARLNAGLIMGNLRGDVDMTPRDIEARIQDLGLLIHTIFPQTQEAITSRERIYINVAINALMNLRAEVSNALDLELLESQINQFALTVLVYPLIGIVAGGVVGGIAEGAVHVATGHGLDMGQVLGDVGQRIEASVGTRINGIELLASPNQWGATAQNINAAMALAIDHHLGNYGDLQATTGMTQLQETVLAYRVLDHGNISDIHTMSAGEFRTIQFIAAAHPGNGGPTAAQVEAANAIVGAVNHHQIRLDTSLIPTDATTGKTYGVMQPAEGQTTQTQTETVGLDQFGPKYQNISITLPKGDRVVMVGDNLEVQDANGTAIYSHLTVLGSGKLQYADVATGATHTIDGTKADVDISTNDYASATSVNATMYVSPDAGKTYVGFSDYVDAKGNIVLYPNGAAPQATGFAIETAPGKFIYIPLQSDGHGHMVAVIDPKSEIGQYLNAQNSFKENSEMPPVDFKVFDHPVYLVEQHVDSSGKVSFEDLAAIHGNGAAQTNDIIQHGTTNYAFETSTSGHPGPGPVGTLHVAFTDNGQIYHYDDAGNIYDPSGNIIGTHFSELPIMGGAEHGASWVDESGIHHSLIFGSDQKINVDPANLVDKFPKENFNQFTPPGYMFMEYPGGNVVLEQVTNNGIVNIGNVISVDSTHHILMTILAPNGNAVGTAQFDLTHANPDLTHIPLISNDSNHPIIIPGIDPQHTPHQFYFKDGSYVVYNENNHSFNLYNSKDGIVATNLRINNHGQLIYDLPNSKNPVNPINLDNKGLTADIFHTLAQRTSTSNGFFDYLGGNLKWAGIPLAVGIGSGGASIITGRRNPQVGRATRNIAIGSGLTIPATLLLGPVGLIFGALGTFEFAVPGFRNSPTIRNRIIRGGVGLGSALGIGLIASNPVGWIAAAATAVAVGLKELRGTGAWTRVRSARVTGGMLSQIDNLFSNRGNFVQNQGVRNGIAAGIGAAGGFIAGLATGGLAWAPIIIGTVAAPAVRTAVAWARGGFHRPNLGGLGTWLQARGTWIQHNYLDHFTDGHAISTGLYTGAGVAGGVTVGMLIAGTGGLALIPFILTIVVGSSGFVANRTGH